MRRQLPGVRLDCEQCMAEKQVLAIEGPFRWMAWRQMRNATITYPVL